MGRCRTRNYEKQPQSYMTLGVTQGHENIDSALLVIWHVNEEQPQILRLAALAQDDRSWFKGGYFQGRSFVATLLWMTVHLRRKLRLWTLAQSRYFTEQPYDLV